MCIPHRGEAEITCGSCGGALAVVNDGRISYMERKAIYRCRDCGHQWMLHAQMYRIAAHEDDRKARRAKAKT